VLLNSGPRRTPQPDSNCPTLGESHEGGSEESSVSQGRETPIDHILYRADTPVGARGDIIQFYNKIFIGFIKDYVLRFSPNEAEVRLLWTPAQEKHSWDWGTGSWDWDTSRVH